MIIMEYNDKEHYNYLEDTENEEHSYRCDKQIPELIDDESINEFINSLEDWD